MIAGVAPLIIAFALVVITGCSTAAKDISARYVSSAQYASYDCEQVEQELIRVSGNDRSAR